MAVSARAHVSDLNASKAKTAPDVFRTIPINFLALLEPHKKNRRLTLRVERLPTKARFSSGKRNGDGSWSLTRDDLEDLNYLLPEGAEENHTLAIRVLELENGKTIAVLDFHIGQPPPPTKKAAAKAEAIIELQALRDELAGLKAELEKRKAAEKVRFAEAEAQWKEALANALNDARTQFLSDRERHASTSLEMKELRDELERAKAALATRVAKERLAPALDDRLETARAAWASEESARLAAAEANWLSSTDGKLRTLRDELSRVTATLKSRDTELSQALQSLNKRDEQLQTSASGLEAARAAWRTEEAARLAAAQTQWQAQTDKAVLEARAQGSASKQRGTDNALQDALRAAHATLAEREAALARLKRDAEDERLRWQQEARDAIALGEREQQERVAAALASAEAQWRRRAEQGQQDTIARAEAAEAAVAKLQSRMADERGLLQELTTMRAALGEREVELTQMRERQAQAQFVAEQTTRPPRDEQQIEAETRTARKRKLVREIVVAASLAAAGAVLYMGVEFLFSGTKPAPLVPGAELVVIEPDALPKAVLLQHVRLRAGPERNESVVAKLVRGTEVLVIEQHKEWTLVRTQSARGLAATREGWVRSSDLKVETP